MDKLYKSISQLAHDLPDCNLEIQNNGDTKTKQIILIEFAQFVIYEVHVNATLCNDTCLWDTFKYTCRVASQSQKLNGGILKCVLFTHSNPSNTPSSQ